jgi:hypothetical protein
MAILGRSTLMMMSSSIAVRRTSWEWSVYLRSRLVDLDVKLEGYVKTVSKKKLEQILEYERRG